MKKNIAQSHQRHIPLAGSYNIRDLGGYSTPSGKKTRWKKILRSGDMHNLTSDTKNALVALGVCTIVDLRRSAELHEKPNALASSSQVSYHHHDLWGDLVAPDRSDYHDASDWWFSHYSMLLDQHRSQVCEAFSTVANPENWPLVFHCAAGKDRTGVMSGLLLSLVGVSNQTISKDYALSAHFLLGRFYEITPPSEIPSGFGWRDYQREHCPSRAMGRTQKHLESVYGGVEGYFIGGGISKFKIDSFRRAFLD